jgi:hypothetical protein
MLRLLPMLRHESQWFDSVCSSLAAAERRVAVAGSRGSGNALRLMQWSECSQGIDRFQGTTVDRTGPANLPPPS